MIAIVDYGVGNLYSLRCSLKAIGQEALVTPDPAEILRADRVILPGVGAFGDAADKLRKTGLDAAVTAAAAAGKPLMGICLGMQLLFETGFEYGVHRGLGLLKGQVRPMREWIDPTLKIPQMGWNGLRIRKNNPLLSGVREGDCVYFVHSYAAVGCEESLLADVDYGGTITACVGKDNVYGCQFHPEKSGEVGLRILRAFCELKGGRMA